jgi:transportin-1
VPDESPEINTLVSYIISAIIRYGQLHNWLDIVELLTANLDHPATVHFALDTLVIICQDSAPELDQPGIQPLQHILPKLISFYASPDPHIRQQAITATSQFVTLKSPSLVTHLDELLASLYDDISHVNEEFISFMTILFESFPHKLEPYLDATIQYMIEALGSDDKMKMHACDFWAQYALSKHFQQQLVGHLPQLVDRLLALMAYSDKELLDIESTTDDSGYYSESEDEEFFSEDSLRKCSALALDVLSVWFGETIAPIIWDRLQCHLENEDWLVRESGILAIGAAAEGNNLHTKSRS